MNLLYQMIRNWGMNKFPLLKWNISVVYIRYTHLYDSMWLYYMKNPKIYFVPISSSRTINNSNTYYAALTKFTQHRLINKV